MQYSREVEEMVCVMKGPNHGPAPIPEEGKWIQAKEISGYLRPIPMASAGALLSRAPAS